MEITPSKNSRKNKEGSNMKDERVNLKVNKITRDRIMAMKYALGLKNIDELFHLVLDYYGNQDLKVIKVDVE